MATFRIQTFLALCAWLTLTANAEPLPTAKPHEINGVTVYDSTNAVQVKYLSPEDEAKTFVLEDGYQLELVLSDPIIREPVLTAFDGDGRMYVAEMRSFMQNVEGTNQNEPTGCVSVHWSSHHDGVYDKHAIFADHLLLPRMVMPLGKGVVINETDSEDFYYYEDTNGDGVADLKRIFHAGGKRGGNMEHQPGGMVMDMDNWIYMPVDNYRMRVDGRSVISETTPPNYGQWGITQDDYGKLFFINAGAEFGPVSFQAPIIYGIMDVPEQREPGWDTVWPLVGMPDMEGGTNRFRPANNTLNHFTSTCGDQIYRGHRLPADLRGDLLYCEPVGRLIRRDKVLNIEGLTRLHSVYTNSEFIRSTDPNFRPINIANAPDGSLYLTDMYRGVIQEKQWMGKDSYLRKVVDQYHLDKNVGRGRIWRLTHPGFKPDKEPKLIEASSEELVNTLRHPSGWWRDMAQQQLVLNGDESAVPALLEMARTDSNSIARLHALWTLEGLHAVDIGLIHEKMEDADLHVQAAAIRIYEELYHEHDESLVPYLIAIIKDKNADVNVKIQALLTASTLHWRGAQKMIDVAVLTSHQLGVQKIGEQLSPVTPASTNLNSRVFGNFDRYSPQERAVLKRGENIYHQLCFACHGMDGRGTPLHGSVEGMTLAPPFQGSAVIHGYADNIVRILLNGLTGPVEGKSYNAQMPGLANDDDEWLAAVASYVRNSFGNNFSMVSSNDVVRIRAESQTRQQPWTIAELDTFAPVTLPNRAQWKLTASNGADTLKLAIDGNANTAYDSGDTQDPGMFVQIELPNITSICGVQWDVSIAPANYPSSYKIQVSSDGKNWSTATQNSSAAVFNQVMFPATSAKFVRIVQTGLDAKHHWSIGELDVLQPPAGTKN